MRFIFFLYLAIANHIEVLDRFRYCEGEGEGAVSTRMEERMHNKMHTEAFDYHYQPSYSEDHITCDLHELSMQLLNQWNKLTEHEVNSAGSNRHRIAQIVARKYNIALPYVENYLRNFERTMPL